MKSPILLVIGLFVLSSLPLLAAPAVASLKPQHPRLIADAASWTKMQDQRRSDTELNAVLTEIERDAVQLLDKSPLIHRKIGRRLLDVSRAALQRILVLATAYHTSDDKRFLERAEKEMQTLSAFEDWNPSHFLDVGEMTTALAYGYDWLYADLTPETRALVRDAIVKKGLQLALDEKAGFNSWQHTENNWNQVCFGGLVLGALAIGDEEPDIANRVLSLARANIHYGLKAYAPDGVFPEGPGYWSYGTSYSVMMVAALDSALGDTWKVPESPGFMASAGAFLQVNGPTGLFFNFSDCGEKGSIEPILFWFARRLGDPGLIQSQLNSLKRMHAEPYGKRPMSESSRFFPLLALWWPERTSDAPPSLPLRWYGRGSNPIAVFRSSWTDTNALYLGLKAGSPGLSHAHMDAGSFVFELDGIRWARDLGSQDYESLESKGVDLWNRKQTSQRWQVFRLNNRSHNTLTINDQLQRVDGEATITAFSDDPEDSKALVDLSPVYAGQATRVRRGFRVLQNREVWIQDELSGLSARDDVRWTLVTAANVAVATDGRHATLTDHGRSLAVDLIAPAEGKLSTIDAAPPANGYDSPNPGRRFLVLHAAPSEGNLTISIRLHRPSDTTSTPEKSFQPLDHWLSPTP